MSEPDARSGKTWWISTLATTASASSTSTGTDWPRNRCVRSRCASKSRSCDPSRDPSGDMKQFGLLRTRRFWPLFWTQFLGAFNDNLFKNALVMLVTFRSLSVAGLRPEQVVMLSGGVFILPYFLFSASAGQLADKRRKSELMRAVKLAEIPIMGLAGLGFWLNLPGFLLAVLFLMGLQSTVFGPAKYSVLPEILERDELVGGNALVEMGTFVAILLGTIAGGLVIAVGDAGALIAAVGVLTVAIAGYVCSRQMLATPPGDRSLRVELNPIAPTWRTLAITRRVGSVFVAVVGISWFWFFGASFLVLLPSYGKDLLGGNEHAVTLYLALFCVGISVGSMLCERLSRRRLEIGLVPLGCLGMSLFAADLFIVGVPAMPIGVTEGMALGEFLVAPGRLRIGVDLFLIAVFGGFYTVPLYTMMQLRAPEEIRARVIAANNVLNALFMVGSSIMLLVLNGVGATTPQLFLILAGLNLVAGVAVFGARTEFVWRFAGWLALRVRYRATIVGAQHLPAAGAALLVARTRHAGDWLLIFGVSDRPLRFAVDAAEFDRSTGGAWLRRANPMLVPAPDAVEPTLDHVAPAVLRALRAGHVVCWLVSDDADLDGFSSSLRARVDAALGGGDVPVLSVRFESRTSGTGEARGWWTPVQVRVGTGEPSRSPPAAQRDPSD
ncbi:MAG: MFS transporter [Myxococcales bacterium FL481]|nr:MAG: MFS transporter [Myxococcales bacterium FL481]